ncbi:hypothetical protein Tco_1268941, partial [Tanacetum coccineum]
GSGTVLKTAPSAAKIKPSVTNEGAGGNDEDDNNNEQDSRSEGSDEENDSDDKNTQSNSEKGSDSEHETDENESGSESDQEENEEEDEDDEEEEENEFVKTPSNDSDVKDEAKITDRAEGDEDEEMDFTTSQLYDDVDIRLNEPVQADEETVQKEGTNTELTNIQQGNENPEISQVIEDAHVTLSTIPKKTEVPLTSSSHLSDLAAKFLNFSDIPDTDAEIVSPIDVHVHHEVPSKLPHSLQYLSRLSLNLHQYTPLSSHNHYHPLLLYHHNQYPHQHQQLKLQILNLHFMISHQSSNLTTESQHWKKKLLNLKRTVLLKLK